MKFNKQLVKHDPENGQWGDCFRTCIANLLDLEPHEVPHFMDRDPPGRVAIGNARAWLALRGLGFVEIPYDAPVDQVLMTIGNTNPEQHWMLIGRSWIADHCVVCKGGKIICDPSGNGITGPASDGYVWVAFITHRTPPGEPPANIDADAEARERVDDVSQNGPSEECAVARTRRPFDTARATTVACEHEWVGTADGCKCLHCPAECPF